MNSSLTIFTLVCLFLSPNLTFSQSRVEKKMVKAVDKNSDYYYDFVKKTININSGTMNFEGVKEVGLLTISEFEKLGLEATWIDGSSWGRAGHVIANTKGASGKPKILLIGHLDTVFEPESPFQEYTMLNDSILQGPGIADMKGGNTIILLALKALKESGQLEGMNLRIVLTGDEEKSGSPIHLSKEALTVGAEWADFAVGFENADGQRNTAIVARRGSSSWTLNVWGKPSHSSQVFTENIGSGAIFEISRILSQFYEELSTVENLTFNPGFIIGGTDVEKTSDDLGGSAFGKTNVVAEKATARGDLRALSIEQLNFAKSKMEEIVKNNYPNTRAEIIFEEGGYPPLSPTEGNYNLLSIYSQVSQDLGYGKVDAVNPRNAGAADVSFTAGLVEGAIDGLGVVDADNDHTIEEYGNLHSINFQAKRAAVLLYRLTEKSILPQK